MKCLTNFTRYSNAATFNCDPPNLRFGGSGGNDEVVVVMVLSDVVESLSPLSVVAQVAASAAANKLMAPSARLAAARLYDMMRG